MARPEPRYTFGEWTLDVPERRLARRGASIALAPKAHDLLVHLVRHAGRLVTKQELLEQIWAGAFVEEGILSVHVSAVRKALGDSNRDPQYIETVQRSGYRFIAQVRRADPDGTAGTARYSIAVLPAQPAEGAPSATHRSIGLALADAVIDRLGCYAGLSVRPTRAIHTLTEACLDPTAAGRTLGVEGIVLSRFARNANQLHVSAHLVRVRDGARIWSGEFNEPRSDGIAIAEAIAESLAGHLGVIASGTRAVGVFGDWAAARRRLTRPPERPQVYELVGRGRSHLLAFSMSRVADAIAAYEAAIDLDPAFAAAHAGLALACCMQAEFRLAPQADAYARARRAALRALALDEASADAQVALGAICFLGEWDWVGAERSLQRALEINPSHTEAYVLYGRLLEALGRLEDGLAMKLRALERDPLSPIVHLSIAMSHWHQRRYQDSIAWANKTLELDPHHLVAREQIAGAYWAMGDFDRHMAEGIKHAETFGAPADFLESMKRVYAAGGRHGLVRWILETQEAALPAFQRALLHSELGDTDEAMRQLERAIDGHEPCLVELAVAPQWDRLRADPRFDRCLARIGLGPGVASA